MLFSYQWLQTFFTEKLPSPDILAKQITFHSSEIETINKVGSDTVFDIKVLPDKSAWLLSHRGMAKELSVILSLPIKNDPLTKKPVSLPLINTLKVDTKTPTCDYYSAVQIVGLKIGKSPAWLQARLEAVGQRSVNNIVDATNYVMFNLGQPLHAFDTAKLTAKDGVVSILVREANGEEPFISLSGEKYTLRPADTVIVDGHNNKLLALAGVKGGLAVGVDNNTTEIILESAHFARTAIRQTAKYHKLQTDASKRYENGIDRTLAQYGLVAGANLIAEIAGGRIVGMASSGHQSSTVREVVKVTLTKINSVLGLKLTVNEAKEIIDRFGYQTKLQAGEFSIIPPFERDDLVLAEDIIEEVGRIYGLEHIVSIPPRQEPVTNYNRRFYYAEKIRRTLVGLGFSEVYTSSFREKDIVKIANALASDKGYLRSTLVENIKEAKERNIPHRDLLGLVTIKVFEIGTVFDSVTEEFRVCLAVQTGTGYKAKADDPLLAEALTAIEQVLGVAPKLIIQNAGVAEFSLDKVLAQLPPVTGYEPVVLKPPIRYRPFSVYPSVSRDIAMWVSTDTTIKEVVEALKASTGLLLVTLTHLDTFTNDEGRISVAFRLVFQASDRTLVAKEILSIMDQVYEQVKSKGWTVR